MFFIRQISGNTEAFAPGVGSWRRTVPAVSEVVPTAPKITDNSPHHAPAGISAALAAYNRVEHPDTPRRRLMFAGEIMTRNIVTLRENESLTEAYQLVTTKRFRHVPVIDESGKIVGVLSDRDLFRHAAGLNSVPENPQKAWGAANQVKEIMSQPVLVGTPDTDIREVAQVLVRERIGCMPIVDESYQVVGIVTRSDVLRTLVVQAPLELWR